MPGRTAAHIDHNLCPALVPLLPVHECVHWMRLQFFVCVDTGMCKVQVSRLQEDLMLGMTNAATRDGVQYVLKCSKRLSGQT